jgi:hypothetical protein
METNRNLHIPNHTIQRRNMANKKETKEINQILENIIKRILLTPTTTPGEAIYTKTGIISVEYMAKENRIMYKNKLQNQEESTQKTLTRKNKGKGWTKTTNEIMKEINITDDDLQESTTATRKTIKEKINTAFEKEINTTGKEKHKVQHLLENKITKWTPREKPPYMTKLTRIEASTIFKARTRMLDVKNNYRNKYRDLVCRGCGKQDETQQHVLEECETIHQNNTIQVAINTIGTFNQRTFAKRLLCFGSERPKPVCWLGTLRNSTKQCCEVVRGATVSLWSRDRRNLARFNMADLNFLL